MATQSIKRVIAGYKKALKETGFPKVKMYLFGSYARNEARPDSDIDLCLVSPAFQTDKRTYEKRAAIVAFHLDPRLEVVLAKPKQFRDDQLSPLYSHIRKEAIAV